MSFARLLVVLLVLPAFARALPPPELAEALAAFRAEGPRGWAFTQTTRSGDKNLIETFNPARNEADRWTLIEKNGRPPTEDDLRVYFNNRGVRGQTAPNVKDQIIPESCELVSTEGDFAAYRFLLRPGAPDDRAAAHMAATFTLHRPTGAISRVELANFESFKPALGMRVDEARTVITYSLPEGDQPALLQHIAMSVRGRTLWLREMNSDMTVTYTDHAYAGRRRPATP